MPKRQTSRAIDYTPQTDRAASRDHGVGYGSFESDRRSDDVDAFFLLSGGESRTAPQTGAKALLLAVLEDALRCYFSGQARIRSEAELWIDSRARTPFSFEVICDVYGIDSSAARAALRRLRAQEDRPEMLRQRHRGTARRSMLAVANG